METPNTTSSATTDKLRGTVRQTVGSAKEAVGEVINDKKMVSDAKDQQLKGKAEHARGRFKEALHEGLATSGDAIERAGEKLIKSGLGSLGNAMKKVGDKIEHLAD